MFLLVLNQHKNKLYIARGLTPPCGTIFMTQSLKRLIRYSKKVYLRPCRLIFKSTTKNAVVITHSKVGLGKPTKYQHLELVDIQVAGTRRKNCQNERSNNIH